MKTITKDGRQNESLRKHFDKVIYDLELILMCFDKKDHKEVVVNYLNTYNLFIGKDSIRGRIFITLNLL